MEKEIRSGIIDIIILFYNKVDQTIACINSFLPSRQYIYVLNNGSDPGQLKQLQQTFLGNKQVHILDAGKNLGVSGGRNYLIQHTEAPWLFSVDNDIVVNECDDWYASFLLVLNENPTADVFIPKLFNIHEGEYAALYELHLSENKLFGELSENSVVNNFPGGAAIISREVFKKYGLYDEAMFVGFEDFEFAVRALIMGEKLAIRCLRIDSIELIHDHRYQKKAADKKAVIERYDTIRMNESFNHFLDKHGVIFEHNWQWWSKNQVQLMTANRYKKMFSHFLSKLKSKIKL